MFSKRKENKGKENTPDKGTKEKVDANANATGTQDMKNVISSETKTGKEFKHHPYEEDAPGNEEYLKLRRKSLREKFSGTYQGELSEDLNDAGTFSYCTLVAASLCNLYDYSGTDKKFIDSTIKMIMEYLGVSKQVKESTMVVVQGDGVENCQPFADFLKDESLVKEHGPDVITRHLLALSLKHGCYDSRSRSLVKYVSLNMKVPWEDMEEFENYLVATFIEAEHQVSEEEKKEQETKDKKRKWKKIAMIGGATIGGGVLLGLTGGLAAPFLATALLGGAAVSTASVAVIGTLFGAAGAGLGGYKMNKRVGDLEEFMFEPLGDDRSLHVTIAISGWVTEQQTDFRLPWMGLDDSKEQYSLKYESKYMQELGAAIDYLMDMAVKMIATEALKQTILNGILAAIAWPMALVSVSNVIDNPWGVATTRSVAVGKHLASVLLNRQQGKRPVTLVGFSMGARVIYHCLQEMARSKNHEGIIEDVIMLGTPVTADPREWAKMKSVVAGRIVNGYCRSDWLLKFVYRTASQATTVAGLQPIKWQDRRLMNIDLTDVVNGHMDYMNKIDDILEIVGVRTRPTMRKDVSEHSLSQWVNMKKVKQSSSSHSVSASSPKHAQTRVSSVKNTRPLSQEFPKPVESSPIQPTPYATDEPLVCEDKKPMSIDSYHRRSVKRTPSRRSLIMKKSDTDATGSDATGSDVEVAVEATECNIKSQESIVTSDNKQNIAPVNDELDKESVDRNKDFSASANISSVTYPVDVIVNTSHSKSNSQIDNNTAEKSKTCEANPDDTIVRNTNQNKDTLEEISQPNSNRSPVPSDRNSPNDKLRIPRFNPFNDETESLDSGVTSPSPFSPVTSPEPSSGYVTPSEVSLISSPSNENTVKTD